MKLDKQLLQDIKKLMIIRYPRFAGEIAKTNLEYALDLPSHTAATDGNTIYFDPSFLNGLSDEDKLFVIAHELMHIKFEHMFRMKDKNGNLRDPQVWNIATDAIINANLERDGFKLKEGYVNIKDALNYNSEELYDKLLREKQKRLSSKGAEGKKAEDGENKDNTKYNGKQNSECDSEAESEKSENQKENNAGDENDNGLTEQIGVNNREKLAPSHSSNEDKNGERSENKENKNDSNENNVNEELENSNEIAGTQNSGGFSENSLDAENIQNKDGQNKNEQDDSDENEVFENYFNKTADNILGDHSLWEKAFERMQKQEKQEKRKQKGDQKKEKGQEQNYNKKPNSQNEAENEKIPDNIEFEEVKLDEKSEFFKNRQFRRELAKQNFDKMKEHELKNTDKKIEFGKIKDAKPILDWKLLLRREVEKTETIWSQRRSIKENNYAYRLEENDIDEGAETEVMIDISGSVSLNMVKAFLKQLKIIVKHSKLKVGCFNEKFWGLTEIKSDKDIDNFKIPEVARGGFAWTEDWDLAVRSFTKKREINKIVFTDGEPCPGTMPKEDLKNINVIWLVYRNKNFNPICGKVIHITPNDLLKLTLKTKQKDDELTL